MSTLFTNRPRRSPTHHGHGSRSLGIGWVFAIVSVVSVLLVIFVLFMQRGWQASGMRAVVLVHEGEVVRRPLTLLITKPETNEMLVVPLPRDERVVLAVSQAEYTSDALIGYTQLEKFHWDYLKLSLALEYGVAVDGLVWVPFPMGVAAETALRAARFGLRPKVFTTLPYWDRLTFWRAARAIPTYKIEARDPSAYLDDQKRLNTQSFDTKFASEFQDPAIRRSNTSVAVLNGSGESGAANRMARMLEFMGYQVRSVDTIPDESESKILLNPEFLAKAKKDADASWTKNRLTSLYSRYKTQEEKTITAQRRSDAVIILGKDALSAWKE